MTETIQISPVEKRFIKTVQPVEKFITDYIDLDIDKARAIAEGLYYAGLLKEVCDENRS